MTSKHARGARRRGRVRPPLGQPFPESRTDQDLTQNVRDLLAFSQEVNVANVEVHTNYGVVTLRGAVASADEREAAERIARSVPGVVDVVNQIVAVPSPRR